MCKQFHDLSVLGNSSSEILHFHQLPVHFCHRSTLTSDSRLRSLRDDYYIFRIFSEKSKNQINGIPHCNDWNWIIRNNKSCTLFEYFIFLSYFYFFIIACVMHYFFYATRDHCMNSCRKFPHHIIVSSIGLSL